VIVRVMKGDRGVGMNDMAMRRRGSARDYPGSGILPIYFHSGGGLSFIINYLTLSGDVNDHWGASEMFMRPQGAIRGFRQARRDMLATVRCLTGQFCHMPTL